MTKSEIIEHLRENGISQLNAGESAQDALDYVHGKIIRKGYQVKHSDGRFMTKNQIIQAENKAAFSRSFTPAEFHAEEVESIDDIYGENDRRDDKTKRGLIANCFYCGTCLRVDGYGDQEDYDCTEETVHCEGCMNDAIMRLAM